MTDTLIVDRGEQLVATFNYPATVTGVGEFVVRANIGDPDPPLTKIRTDDSPASADGTVTISGTVVTVTVNGSATQALPAAARWALWINPGADDAQVVSGSLRVREVVQP